jgi:hypothetical protein
MANFIIKNGYEKYQIVGYDTTSSEALLPYLPKIKFWYPEFETYGTFVKYNKKYFTFQPLDDQQLITKVKQAFPDQSKVIILLFRQLDNPDSFDLKLIYTSKTDNFWPDVQNESYWLYGPKNNPKLNLKLISK